MAALLYRLSAFGARRPTMMFGRLIAPATVAGLRMRVDGSARQPTDVVEMRA